jgi:hypothetical protein
MVLFRSKTLGGMTLMRRLFYRSEAYKREDVVMSTTKDYEECFIMFSTMTLIKKTLHNKDKQNKTRSKNHLRFAVT